MYWGGQLFAPTQTFAYKLLVKSVGRNKLEMM
jgi:hypothetical protein